MHFKVFKLFGEKTKQNMVNNKPFKKWFNDIGIKMYSTHNEGKSIVAERFIMLKK